MSIDNPSPSRRAVALRVLIPALAGVLGWSLLCAGRVVCLSTFVFDGVRLSECPDGDLQQTVVAGADSLRRGSWSRVWVGAEAWYTWGPADEARSAPVRRVDAEVSLVKPDGSVLPLETKKGWDDDYNHRQHARVMIPAELPDGDYILRATADTPLGAGAVDVPLPIYAPATVHLLTDRPLYEPGNTVQFRAVVLRSRDLVPLEHRPGRWTVETPTGEQVLDEKAPTGDWGVVAGAFPIDAQAESGTWKVCWRSGEDGECATFVVEPFTLPRFTVSASADRPYYLHGDAPVVEGSLTYASGAPVGDAAVRFSWGVSGPWPAPTSWQAGALPKLAQTDRFGRFRIALPEIPEDLVGQATLAARIEATDPAGDRVTGAVSLLLSEDPIQVQAVTEMGESLVDGFNNRVYLRATTAAGVPLADTKLVVSRAWDPRDKGRETVTDADGVAALQFDPGPPVNVMIPAQPVRPAPVPPPVVRGQTTDRITGDTPGLADQLALDRALAGQAACARWVENGQTQVKLALLVSPSGRVTQVEERRLDLEACLGQGLLGAALSPGRERVIEMMVTVNAADLPTITRTKEAWPRLPTGMSEALDAQALDARACLSATTPDTGVGGVLRWQATEDSTAVETAWVATDKGSALSDGERACVRRVLARVRLDEPADWGALGLVHYRVAAAPRQKLARPQPTTMLGYELAIKAVSGDEDLGRTVLRLPPGQIPNLRLRAEPVLAKAGEKVTFTFLRGPDYAGTLPEELYLRHADGAGIKGTLDKESRTFTYTLPKDKSGWFSLSWSNVSARVFVEPAEQLSLELTPDADVHKPGDLARIAVRTTSGDKGVPAAVGLFGVDETLGQLVPLPGPDAFESVVPQVTTGAKAFGVLDGQALVMGRIAGRNAAAATVLRVSQVPTPADIDRYVSTQASGSFDPVATLTDRFYVVLGALHAQVRAWEKTAPAGEKMRPETMAGLWSAALDDAEAAGEAVTDAYGRRLRLHQLPLDLLALTEARAVVVDGTRLTEDTENWAAWVAREEP